jgi:hypothetical protein
MLIELMPREHVAPGFGTLGQLQADLGVFIFGEQRLWC